MQAGSDFPFNIILTGGIGSGKTVVSDTFDKLNVAIIDTDIISRQVVEPLSHGLKQLVDCFGNKILHADQSLNRAVLRQIAFSDNDARINLNKILHPLINQEVYKQLSEIKTNYCITVVPLFDRSNTNYPYNRVLVVESPEELQIERASKRDNCSPEHITQIIAAQSSNDQRRKQADDIILNTSGLDYLIHQVHQLHEKYLKLSQSVGVKHV
jgi:dephospho-CoA kinase